MNQTGRIVCRTRGFYYLRTPEGEEVEAKIKGSLYKDKSSQPDPIVGDEVKFTSSPQGGHVLISEVLARRSSLKRAKVGARRKIIMAVNIDCALIVASLAKPSHDYGQTIKILSACYQGNVEPVVVLTKCDIVGADSEQVKEERSRFESMGVRLFITSSFTVEGIDELKQFIKGRHVSLCGVSGSGKSSLVNVLFPGLGQRTQEVNERYDYGRHTTTVSRLFEPEPGFVISDNPGFRNFTLALESKEELKSIFPVIKGYDGKCSLRDCLHDSEGGCAVKQAVSKKELDSHIYEYYLITLNQL